MIVRLVVVGALVLTLAGCGGTDSTTTAATAEAAGRSAGPGLATALLQPDDVRGAGYAPITQERPDRAISSTRADCSSVLDALEIDPPADPAVVEVRALFGSDVGQVIQHVVRQYPADAAAPYLSDAITTLSTCSEFELGYADGSRTLVRLAPSPVPNVPGVAWIGDLSVDARALTLAGKLVLLRKEDRVAVLSLSAADAVDPQLVRSLTTRAATLLGNA